MEGSPEKRLIEPGFHLLATVMVVDAVRKPHAFEIHPQGLEILFRLPVESIRHSFAAPNIRCLCPIISINGFERLPDTQIVTAELVGSDVASAQRSL